MRVLWLGPGVGMRFVGGVHFLAQDVFALMQFFHPVMERVLFVFAFLNLRRGRMVAFFFQRVAGVFDFFMFFADLLHFFAEFLMLEAFVVPSAVIPAGAGIHRRGRGGAVLRLLRKGRNA